MTFNNNSDAWFPEIHLNLNSDLCFLPEALQIKSTSLTYQEMHVHHISKWMRSMGHSEEPNGEERARERFNDTSQSLLLSLSNIYGASPPWLNIKRVSLYIPLLLCNTLLPFSPPSCSFYSTRPLTPGTSASPSPYTKWIYNFPYSLHHHC